jgi:hypothetical protein
MLCDRCSIAISDILTCNLDSSRWKVEPFLPEIYLFYLGSDRKIAENSSLKICFICQTAHQLLLDISRNGFGLLDNDGSGTFFISIPLKCAGFESTKPWITFIQKLPNLNPHTPKGNILREPLELYLCGASSDRPNEATQPHQLDIKISSDLYRHFGTHRNHHSGSKSAIDLAMSWSTHCASFHPECSRRKQEHELPTRVIDIALGGKEPSDFQDVRLILTNGLRGHYASLSHRWSSTTKQFCTTKNNFQQHMKCMPLERLPRTFRESIILCRQFDIRYLWIDCLCIIQDDNEDWQKECEKMSDIFENSYLTISALQARDSDGGLFQLREQDTRRAYLRSQEGILLGLRQEGYNLASDVRLSSTGSRGRILQEKILSPALLHFGNWQMHWECQSATISENRANVQIPGSGPLKNVLHEVQRVGCHSYPRGHFIAWNMIIQHYSHMDFTLEYDRLPAILGLAQRFQQSYRSTFVAGLWLEDLHRGLLWNRSNRKAKRVKDGWRFQTTHTKCATAPSWSWIPTSSNNNVRFEWDEDFPDSSSPVFLATRLQSDTDAELVDATVTPCPQIHRGAVHGTLQLWGIIIKAKLFRSPSGNVRSTVQRMHPEVSDKRQPLHPTFPNIPL